MKVYMKPVKMLSMSEENGVITPIRFQMKTNEREYITVKIDNITERAEEKLAGNRMYIFKCQSEIDGVMKMFEVKFELQSCKWFLYKM